MPTDFKRLTDHRNFILLSELGALIHDLGKFSREFLESKSSNGKGDKDFIHNVVTAREGNQNDKDYPVKLLSVRKEEYEQVLKDVNMDPQRQKHRAFRNQYEILKENYSKVYSNFLNDNFKNALSQFKDELNPKFITDSGSSSGTKRWPIENLAAFLELHHKAPRKYLPLVVAIFSDCDALESSFDNTAIGLLQNSGKFATASAFGWENMINTDELSQKRRSVIEALTEILNGNDFLNDISSKREEFIKEYSKVNDALGYTLRSGNDVALFDHSYSAASLFKAELARRVVENDWSYDENSYYNLNFQLLAVKWSWWDLVSKSYKTTDILGRQLLLDEFADDFKKLFEVEVPLGNEIYRDEDGIYFVIGNYQKEEFCKAWKEWIDPKMDSILQKVGGEFSFNVYMLKEPTRSMTSLVDAVSEENSKVERIASFGQESYLRDTWSKSQQNKGDLDICPVCRLRPKPQHAKACRFCISLRESGAREGRRKLEEELDLSYEFTKWTGELADENSTIAMVSGKFDLTSWFDGSLFTTLFGFGMEHWSDGKTDNFIKKGRLDSFTRDYGHYNPYAKAKMVLTDRQWEFIQPYFSGEASIASTLSSDILERYGTPNELLNDLDYAINLISRKYPSSGRLRRVWRATENYIRGFIGGQQRSLVKMLGARSRVQFRVRNGISNLGKGYYEVVTERLPIAFSDVYHKGQGLFSIVENLGSSPRKEYLDALKGASLVLLREDGTETTLIIEEVIVDSKDKYLPFTPLLVSPEMFHILVPGNKAIEVLRLIKSEYEKQFNKVKNRLPLDLGVVFFKKKFPLYVVIDAARKMMEMGKARNQEWWTVASIRNNNKSTTLNLKPETGSLFSVPFEWRIDGSTIDEDIEDQFYPYFFVEENNENINARSYRRSYSDKTRWRDSHYNGEPVILARDLKERTKTKISPSYFDFELLDSTSRRYDLWYNKDRVRRHHILGARKPYYLDDIDLFERLKEILVKNLDGRAALKRLYALIQTKFEEWRDPVLQTANGTIRHIPALEGYVEDVIINVFGHDNWSSLSGEERDLVKGACLSGAFFDCVDLYDSILKIDWAKESMLNPKREKEKEEIMQQ